MIDIRFHLANCPGVWRPSAPASEASIASLRSSAGSALPESYFQFLGVSNGGEGDLAVEPGWVSFWPAEHVVELNSQYEIASAVPGLFGIGSNGGGELIALDMRFGPETPVVAIPFVPLSLECMVSIAPTFDALVSLVGVELGAA